MSERIPRRLAGHLQHVARHLGSLLGLYRPLERTALPAPLEPPEPLVPPASHDPIGTVRPPWEVSDASPSAYGYPPGMIGFPPPDWLLKRWRADWNAATLPWPPDINPGDTHLNNQPKP